MPASPHKHVRNDARYHALLRFNDSSRRRSSFRSQPFLGCIELKIFSLVKVVVFVIVILFSIQQLLFVFVAEPSPTAATSNTSLFTGSFGNYPRASRNSWARKALGWKDHDRAKGQRIQHQIRDSSFQQLAKNLESRERSKAGKTNGHGWKLTTEDRKLGSSRAGELADRFQELLELAKLYLKLSETYEGDQFVEELQDEVSRCVALLEDAGTEGQTASEEVSPERVLARVDALTKVVGQAKQLPYDGTNLLARLHSRLESAEQMVRATNMQSRLYSQIVSKAVPPGLHCLSMRLTIEYSKTVQEQRAPLGQPAAKLINKGLFHYALSSDNVLAAAVVVNSTVQNLKQPWRHVFHIVTDRTTYAAMYTWFALNPPHGVTLEVKCLDEYPWINASYVPVLKQMESEAMKRYYYRATAATEGELDSDDVNNFKFRNPKYLSILNHLRFYLPEIFPELDKVLFLDDDVVVQRDLSPLWQVPMNGKVILAVETCRETFHRYWTYLNFSSPLLARKFDPEGCAWAFGMNLFDLDKWRAGNYTDKYRYWQQQNADRSIWKLGSLPAGLLTFYGAVEPLDKWWHVLGLGSFTNLSLEAIEKAAVIHYNGHAKPWLELAILRYQKYWARYAPYSNTLLTSCFVTPP